MEQVLKFRANTKQAQLDSIASILLPAVFAASRVAAFLRLFTH